MKDRQRKKRASNKQTNTVAPSRFLENAISGLRHLDFQSYKNYKEFTDAGTPPKRYLIRHYPHCSLFGTPGFKEAFIHNCGVEYIFEAKYQNIGGSVDEKVPYLFEAFLVSHVPNWIVWFDGNYWTKNSRAVAAIAWLRKRIAAADFGERQFFICASEDEWVALVDKLFKVRRDRAA